MRTRSRSQEIALQNPQSSLLSVTWTDPSIPPLNVGGSYDLIGTYLARDEEISDVVALRPQVYVDPQTGRWKRFKYPPSTVGKVFRPCHPCTHVKTVITPQKDITIAFGGHVDIGSPSNERFYQYTDIYADGASYLASNLTESINDVFDASDTNYSAAAYRKHDWFALADSFYEACDQFIPSSFNLGEDLAESEIFKEAFIGLLLPTRAIKSFLGHAVKHIKNSRKKNLGQISAEIAKQGVNAHLSYIFGVSPAINDIKSVLKAHASVSQRMKILHERAGHYVPIRVRQKLDSPFENFDFGPYALDGTSQFYRNCSEKKSVAVASAFGRVREDMTFGSTWSAYLQYFGVNKMIGLAWELIPFSFVIDWFTNAQERINSLTRLQTGGPFTEIRNLSVSSKQTMTETLFLTPGYNHSYGFPQIAPTSPLAVAQRTTSRYERFLTFPDTSGVFDFSALGLFQYTAGFSLILQRLLRL